MDDVQDGSGIDWFGPVPEGCDVPGWFRDPWMKQAGDDETEKEE